MFPYFELFGRQIGMYPVMAGIGALVSGFFACRTAKKRGLDDNTVIFALLFASIGVVVGGCLLYGITNLHVLIPYLRENAASLTLSETLKAIIQSFSGMVFYGGLLLAILFAYLYLKRKQNAKLYCDILATHIPLFHAFARIGCFLGGCCYGVECSFGFVATHCPIESANGVCRFPVQLAESLFNLLLFALLRYMLKKGKLKGKLTVVYLACYAVGRFLLEFLRGDEYRGFLLGVSTSQFISLLILLGVAIYALLLRKKAHSVENN